MFKPTNRQVSLLEPKHQAADSVRRRLEASWAEGFAAKVLPLLLEAEEDFAKLYGQTGRPNWSAARMLGICLLQEMRDLDDQTALDSLAFDMRWQHALGLTSADAYLSRRSLVEFRSRLASLDPQMAMMRRLFERIGAAAIEDLSISTKEQRIDSTLVRSNIYTRGRIDLFRKTLLHFLDWLTKERPARVGLLKQRTRKWHSDMQERGWFGKVDKKKYDKEIRKLAWKLDEVTQVFAKYDDVNQEEPYLLVARLFAEHCERKTPKDGSPPSDGPGTTEQQEEEEEAVVVHKSATDPGKSLQSPYDPDAGCGYKGPGYSVQVTETCRNDAAGVEIITDFEVAPANTSDRGKHEDALDRLTNAGSKPEVLYADGGYPTGQSVLDTAARGTELIAPMTWGRLPEATIGRDAFRFDEMSGECTACPQGHAPTRHALRTTGQNLPPTMHAYFDGQTCRSCPLLGRCVVRGPNNGKAGSFHLELGAHLLARDKNLAAQRERAWWDTYAIRSGVEATMSELKRQHGMAKLRVRRLPRVRLAVALKVTACNVKRWMRKGALGRPIGSDEGEDARLGAIASSGAPWWLVLPRAPTRMLLAA